MHFIVFLLLLLSNASIPAQIAQNNMISDKKQNRVHFEEELLPDFCPQYLRAT